ncbi:MAG TPA: Spy/CpxP family protein refolding chaperone [Alphaproteobacteria bacterium]|nr:Spy/CpxP family protein refolding chaperone [Alphaproteobacteria bacterium]
MFNRIDKIAPAVTAALAFGAFTLGGTFPAAAQDINKTSIAQDHRPTDATAQRPVDRTEARIAELRAKLHVTTQQGPQWDAFVGAERDSAKEMSELIERRERDAKGMNAVDDFRSYGKIAEAHADGLKKIIPAFEALYDSLSDDQKKAADTMFRNPGGRTS